MPTTSFSAGDINYIAKLNELANASFSQQIKTANFAAAKGYLYMLTVTGLQVTLPVGPAAGDRFRISSGSSAVKSVTLLYGADKIDSVAANITLPSEAAMNVELTYVNATIGWRIIRYSIGYAFVIISANYTAVTRDAIMADTSAGAFTIALPAAPVINDYVVICDYKRTFGTNKLTVARAGNKIELLAEDMDMSSNGEFCWLTFIDSTVGWKFT